MASEVMLTLTRFSALSVCLLHQSVLVLQGSHNLPEKANESLSFSLATLD